MNEISRKLNADDLILQALREDIPGEDVSTNAVMPEACPGTVDLIAKEDGVIAGLDIYARVFTLLDEKTEITFFCKDGDEIRKGQKLAVLRGDIRVLLSGERVALNMPIQGTAADIMKLAMAAVWKRLRQELPEARLVLQVHDELIVEAPAGEVERVKALLKEKMEQVVRYSVPLTVDVGTGKTWLEAH